MRQACAADHAAISDFLTGLSMQARYLRFFTGAPRTSPAMLRVLAGAGDNVDAIVAVEDGAIIGHAMASDAVANGRRESEIGVVVADTRQGQGIGSALVRTLAARAQARGATALVMEVLAENRQVLAMIAEHWPAARHDRSGACVTISAHLPTTRTASAGTATARTATARTATARAVTRREDWPGERLAVPH
jgi:GNAT superfamily N-acetyltransferase